MSFTQATAMLRFTSSSVGDDRTFSFEITEGGKYVVYTGDCDVEVYEDDV